MRNYVRRPTQALARELEQQLSDAVPEPYVESPEEKALLDSYETTFARMFDDDYDDFLGLPILYAGGLNEDLYEDFDEDFDCNCELCRMQDCQ
jgi:hypothetical protein